MEALDVAGCPECGAAAEVVDRYELASTSGPIEHVKVVCAQRHWFMLPAERCPGAIPMETPIGTSVREDEGAEGRICEALALRRGRPCLPSGRTCTR